MTKTLTATQLMEKHDLTLKELAFAQWLISEGNLDSLEDFNNEWETGYNENIYTNGNIEYIVVDDDEGDVLWDEYLDNYIDDCVLDELPEQYRHYFDDEKFKQDCRIDGRAHFLSTYDGDENEYTVNSETFYFYRTN